MDKCPVCSMYGCEDHSLFGARAWARRTDPDTSHDAAAAAKVGRTDAHILLLLRDYTDRTCRELGDLSEINLTILSPRFKPLRVKKLIEQTGEKRVHPEGAAGYVYRITDAGRKALRHHLEESK